MQINALFRFLVVFENHLYSYYCSYIMYTKEKTLLCFQLVVGSEDYDIRVFKEDEIIAEMTETEVGELGLKNIPYTYR